MGKIRIQILINNQSTKDIQDRIFQIFKETLKAFEDVYHETDIGDIDSYLDINYTKEVGENKLIGLDLLLDEQDLEQPEEVVQEFLSQLQDCNDILLVLRFSDDFFFRALEDYYKALFMMEMRLREVVTFIFVDTFKSDYFNLLRDLNVKPQKHLGGKEPNEDYYRSHYENEFFFLLFSDYKSLDRIKDLKVDELTRLINSVDSFDDLQMAIANRGIIKEEYKAFLSSIKEDLDYIECLRNCIAHHRSITNSVMENYDAASEKLIKKIDSFWTMVGSK